MYGDADKPVDKYIPIEHNHWVMLRQASEGMYMYLGKCLDDPLLAFNNWEKE